MVRFLKNILSKVNSKETLEDKILKSTKQEVETQTTILEKKAGVYKEPKETKSDYVGVPAPVYLKDDEWFGSAPEYTEKQKDYMVQETEIKRQEFEKSFSVEPEDIHQKMYEISTKSQNTTLHLNPPGGSENFQEGGWQSGTGFGQYR